MKLVLVKSVESVVCRHGVCELSTSTDEIKARENKALGNSSQTPLEEESGNRLGPTITYSVSIYVIRCNDINVIVQSRHL